MDPFSYHGIHGSVRWRVGTRGVEIEGSGIERTPGYPATITKLWSDYRDAIEKAAFRFSVPIEYILATIATESEGNPLALRHEPGYISDEATPHKVSAGLMQVLLSTASMALGIPVSVAWLQVPENGVLAGTKYIRDQASISLLDGPMVFAAYNAGSVYRNASPNNRWKMRQYPIGTSKHCDRAIRWLNDAVSVTLGGEISPRGWAWYLRGLTARTLV